jgi:Spy/CpxP family protein refolding chaperone
MRSNNLNNRFSSQISGFRTAGLFLFVLLLSYGSSFGDTRRHPKDSSRMNRQEIPNLSPEQKTKIKAIRIQSQKEILPLKGQLGEKKAKLQTLEMAEKPDMAAINGLIDEMHALEGKISKLRAAQKQEIRKLLTTDQRVVFDTKFFNRGKIKRNKQGTPRHELEK